MSVCKIIAATDEILKIFYGDRPLPGCSMIAHALILDDEPMAIAGVCRNANGVQVAFSDFPHPLNKREIVRLGRVVMTGIITRGKPVMAWCGNPRSRALLEHLGFQVVDECQGQVYMRRSVQ